jgi:hypothetical protein
VPKFLSSPANAGNDLDEQDISQENLDGNRQNYQNGSFASCSPDAPLYRNDRINIAPREQHCRTCAEVEVPLEETLAPSNAIANEVDRYSLEVL